jgi:SpoIID/LytB domain protein
LASIDTIAYNSNGRPTRIRVIDERDASVELSAENLRRAANYSGQDLNPPHKPLRSSHVRASFNRSTVSFEGYGFGHGVGLCQHGTEIHAKAGLTHRDILRWYYPGVELVGAYL